MRHIVRDGFVWKMIPGACEVEPPVSNSGPCSSTTTSVSPRSARWHADDAGADDDRPCTVADERLRHGGYRATRRCEAKRLVARPATRWTARTIRAPPRQERGAGGSSEVDHDRLQLGEALHRVAAAD